ncbi:hypothetical protein F4779DRAFT_576270 [Xylariaceae sp. FL0662B]|nr:hypothetical protein F4779DRAFT_576270 [Xylariaceae sp. FL0662B]
MFKACDYCRHRKKKCVVPPASARCSDCEHLDLPCDFSLRSPSLMRRQTSRQIAARIGKTTSITSTWQKAGNDSCSSSSGGDNGADEANLKEGDCQLRLAGRRDMANKRLFQPREPADDHRDGSLSMSAHYWRDVHPFWPFVTSEMLEEAESGRDPNLKHCIDLACLFSLNSMKELDNASLHTESLVPVLHRDQLSTSIIAGTLVLCPFVYYDDELYDKIFDTVEHEIATARVTIPPSVQSAALLTNAWRRLAGHSHQPLHVPIKILQDYVQELDPTTYGYHYLRVSRLAAELDQRCMAMDVEGIQADSPLIWSRLEYECLLWQVCLPPSLLDTRDDLPATPESVVIHCFSNTLLLSLYSYIIEHADTLGTMIALRPVPGVLLFMCILARSTFICPRKLLDRMSILVSIQAQTVRIMLRLWHQTNFENCRAILNLWENPGNRFPDLARQVREEIGLGPWAVEEVDGYSVFWTFRDLRTLTTKFVFAGSPSLHSSP